MNENGIEFIPGEDTAGEANVRPEIPPMRTFTVTRMNPVDCSEITEQVVAHEAEINAAGNILRFREYFIDPVTGAPSTRVVRCYNGWREYAEQRPVVVARPSALIIPFPTN